MSPQDVYPDELPQTRNGYAVHVNVAHGIQSGETGHDPRQGLYIVFINESIDVDPYKRNMCDAINCNNGDNGSNSSFPCPASTFLGNSPGFYKMEEDKYGGHYHN